MTIDHVQVFHVTVLVCAFLNIVGLSGDCGFGKIVALGRLWLWPALGRFLLWGDFGFGKIVTLGRLWSNFTLGRFCA
jgi:hypothetical protein